MEHHENDKMKTTTCTNVAEKSVLLQTGRAQVVNSDDQRYSSFARFMFDGGSMKSYVTDALRRKLKLPTIRSERLMMSTFGMEDSDIKTMDVVQVKVKSLSNSGYIYFEALVTPVICVPLSNQRLKVAKTQYKHLEPLYLSDYVDCNEMFIDILIGADYYFSFMTGKCIKGVVPGSPVALESCIGWVLTGPIDGEAGNRCSSLRNTHVVFTSADMNIDETLKRFW